MHRTVMGILTATAAGTVPRAPLWPQRRTFRELSLQGDELGVLVYVFSHRDVDWRRRRVYGYRFARGPGGTRRWQRMALPFPDVVYNRVPSRTAENRPAVHRCLMRLAHRLQDRLFNPFYLNKWQVYRCLTTHPLLARHLPPTRPLRRWSDLRASLNQHGRVFCKPAGGSLGNYAMEIRSLGQGRYSVRYNLASGRTRRAGVLNLEGVRRVLGRLARRRTYVVQQAIPLAQVDGRRFDVRVLVQKDASHAWRMTGAACRVAGPGQITTHVPRGGRQAPFEPTVGRCFTDGALPDLKRRLETVAVKAAEVLEAGLGRNFAEMSLDVGIDRDGHLWIFEMNAKPLRFDEAPIQRASVRRIVEYARTLAQAASPSEPASGRLQGA